MNSWIYSWQSFSKMISGTTSSTRNSPPGLRRGEICGLKWTDFDEIDGTLKVRRTIHQEKGGKLTAWDTKTAAGARTIILPPSTVELLRERQKSALTEWIFPDPLRPEQPTAPALPITG